TSRFTCTFCMRSRFYKTQRGLQRHETIKHKEHNILPSYILPLPDYKLDHVKKVMVWKIQKRLKKHHRTVGNQLLKFVVEEADQGLNVMTS
ncbi:28970_t:CDS:2, partial [Racocetra persica]